jgi:hypothetical protein
LRDLHKPARNNQYSVGYVRHTSQSYRLNIFAEIETMQDLNKAQNLSGVMLVCACMFALGTVGLTTALKTNRAADKMADDTTSFETLQDCQQQTGLEVAAHFDKDVRENLVQSFCTKTKEAGLIENIPVSAAGITSPIDHK